MKIRTDFVTNSSSWVTAEVVIDNPILLEVLQRYKEKGVFKSEELYFDVGMLSDPFVESSEIKSPVFSYWVNTEDGPTSHPESLDQVLETIIEVMDGGGNLKLYDKKLYEQMKLELINRKKEIDSAYLLVKWVGEISLWGGEESEGDSSRAWKFYYDPERGEKFTFE